mmetsp:Transcript_8900/g.14912  ORF Transcript_8900/g.14912 Transcript_8900/m.14912 type:complete len:406 (-) Transcript_8900:419-1636(-)|eukprot:CAMPEP_0119325670 /NCGR_PEP_ID=MMETSP1333-20130426/66435_1 /TAXON_ID=418940 /ORGANISM="Scyphosphaera apsteinii, Strain RCC1455" /LENGTH=405 /DNA_ID=CAMNT_0007333727 /DNA_START=48 /DNA_END=1265 /DNA_ORIENTATION=-
MLYADKQALETDLKVSLLAIRERELSLYTENCRSIGTQAALLAGFAYGGACLASYFFPEDSSDLMRASYLVATTFAMDLNVAALFASTMCTMFGPGLALRGPDGSMEQAVEGLALEYRLIFVIFFLGLLFFYISACLYVIIVLNWLLAILITGIVCLYMYYTLRACKRIYKKFRLPSHQAVAGNFAVDGTVGTSVGMVSIDAKRLEMLSQRKFIRDWPIRQYLYLRLFLDEFIGVYSDVYEQRYRNVAEKGDRWYNASITNILRNLEMPNNPFSSPKDFYAGEETGTSTIQAAEKTSNKTVPAVSSVRSSTRTEMSSVQMSTCNGGLSPSTHLNGQPNHSTQQFGVIQQFRNRGWFMGWKPPTRDEVASLPRSANLDFELAAMRPIDFHNSGALSPPDSEDTLRM